MIQQLEIRNFRCFEHHTVPFRPMTVVVGKNNAGKSTIVDALRLISLAVARMGTVNFSDLPNWLDIPRRNRGFRPSIRGVQMNLQTVFHRYGKPPAEVRATLETGHTVSVYVGPESEIYAVVLDASGHPFSSKGQAKSAELPPVEILPQVGPLQREERLLDSDYVRKAMSSDLAPLHFRNELFLFPEARQRFMQLAGRTWHGVRVEELTRTRTHSETFLSLLVRDGGFVAEVAWMGHGLQMWLQAMWFLARVSDDSVVILDEPDVYMHADLQRRLVRLIRGRYRQTIIATHSVEIMAEVEPEEVLVVDRQHPISRFTTSLPAVQGVVDRIGGVHNLQLSRLWSAKKCLLIEGYDLDILRRIHHTLFPNSEEPLDTIPNMSIGGWGGWNYAVGSSMFLRNAGGGVIRFYCLFDRDYHTNKEIADRKEDAKRRDVELHVWSRKEVENFLLVPETLHRAITEGLREGKERPTLETIVDLLDEGANSLRHECTDVIAEELWRRRETSSVAEANRLARGIVNDAWESFEGRLAIVSGKALLAKISEWSQKKFGVSLGAAKLAVLMRADEIPTEMVGVITALERGQAFEIGTERNGGPEIRLNFRR